MPLILAGSWYFTRYLQPRHHHYWEAVGKQASALVGMLGGDSRCQSVCAGGPRNAAVLRVEPAAARFTA